MQCPNCGEPVSKYGAYCGHCGTVISRDGSASHPANPRPSHVPASPQPASERTKRRRWPLVIALVVILALVALIAVPLLREQSAANRDEHRVTFVMKTPGYNNEATPIPVHVSGTQADGRAYDKLVYLDGGGNGVILGAGEYVLSFPGGSILANGTVLLAPADQQLEVTVPTGLARNEFVQVPADQVVAYTAIAPLDITDETLDAVYQLAAENPADNGRAATLRQNAQQAHADAQEKKAADTAAMEKKTSGPLNASVGDEAQFMGTLQICTPEEAGERLDDEDIQWNLYGHTLAILWLDEPRKVRLEDASAYNSGYYYSGYDGYDSSYDEKAAYTTEYEVRCLILNADVEGLYSYNAGDDGTLAAHDGKRILASGKIATVTDWVSSQISPITLVNPTLEDV